MPKNRDGAMSYTMVPRNTAMHLPAY